jgi:hypothetical protein
LSETARPARRSRRPSWLDVAGTGFLPGFLAGIQIGGLLFFLNPGLPFAPGPVARAALLYGLLLGAVSLALSLPWTWGRPRRARRLLPWGLSLALAFAAVLDGAHASYYAYYLPSGINDRLIKAALWLSLAALIFFYTALLHTLHRRAYGPRSRWGLAILAALSVYVMVERREAFQPRPEVTPQPAIVESGRRPRLLVVGLDAATLDALLPLAGEGRLPFLAGVIHGGAYGRLESISPHHPSALWTTLATGKYPFRHGVTGGRTYSADLVVPGADLHLLPAGIGFDRWGLVGGRAAREPRRARAALTLWEILDRLGVRAGLLGWPASAPVPKDLSFAFTGAFFHGPPGRVRVSPRHVQPPELAATAELLRVSPADIGAAALSRFGEVPPSTVRGALANDAWRERLTTHLLNREPRVSAFFLELPGLAAVSREYFGGFSAVEFDGSRARLFRQATQYVGGYYAHLDDFLAALWEKGDGPRILAVVSAYGVDAPGPWARWKREVSQRAALGGRFEGSPDGLVVLYGEGIRPGALITGARLVDLVPTLLYGLGYPVARDFDGQVLTQAFDPRFLATHPLTFLPSYEALAGVGPAPPAASGSPRPSPAGRSEPGEAPP